MRRLWRRIATHAGLRPALHFIELLIGDIPLTIGRLTDAHFSGHCRLRFCVALAPFCLASNFGLRRGRQLAKLEATIDGIVGVVTSGLFAKRGADVLLLATPEGVQTFERT